MKKKGLIISTVVMAVVLIASLTTATYAWFSAASSASIDQIAVNVGAASNVQIGVVANTGARTNIETYVSGDVKYTASGWEGVEGLGSMVTTGLSMEVAGAVGTGAAGAAYKQITEAELADATDDKTPYIEQVDNAYVWTEEYLADTENETFAVLYTVPNENAGFTEFVPDASTNKYSGATKYYVVDSAKSSAILIDPVYTPVKETTPHALYTAMGNNYAELQDQKLAIINGLNATTAGTTDVLDLKMGITAAKEGVYGTLCTITIKPNQATLGMIAALWADIEIESEDVTDGTTGKLYDLFSNIADTTQKDGKAHYNSKLTGLTTNSVDGAFTFYFVIDQPGDSQLVKNAATDVTYFDIRLFISGYDSDSISAATGTSATIDINFYGIEKDGNNYKVGDKTMAQFKSDNKLIAINSAFAASDTVA